MFQVKKKKRETVLISLPLLPEKETYVTIRLRDYLANRR